MQERSLCLLVSYFPVQRNDMQEHVEKIFRKIEEWEI